MFAYGDADGDGELDYDEVKNVYSLIVGIDNAVQNGATTTTEYSAEQIQAGLAQYGYTVSIDVIN